MRVLVCGSRTYNRPVLEDGTLGHEGDDLVLDAVMAGIVEDYWHDVMFITGAARGADRSAENTAAASGYPNRSFPADWDRFGKRAGYVRNQQMLDEGQPDVVIAFVDKPLAESKGTEMMVDIAKRAGKPVYVIERIN